MTILDRNILRKGELTLSLALFSLITILMGTVLGGQQTISNNVQKLFSRAQEPICQRVGYACKDTYPQTCAKDGQPGIQMCHKIGKCTGIGDGTQCSWGQGSYCDACETNTEQKLCSQHKCIYSQRDTDSVVRCYEGNCRSGENCRRDILDNNTCTYVVGCSSGQRLDCPSNNNVPTPTRIPTPTWRIPTPTYYYVPTPTWRIPTPTWPYPTDTPPAGYCSQKTCIYSQQDANGVHCYVGNCRSGENCRRDILDNNTCTYVVGCSSGLRLKKCPTGPGTITPRPSPTPIRGRPTPTVYLPILTQYPSPIIPKTRKVLLIIHNPQLKTRENKRLFTEIPPAMDPKMHANTFLSKLNSVPNNTAKYVIVDTVERSTLPPMQDETNLKQYEIDMLSCVRSKPEFENEQQHKTPTASCQSMSENTIDYKRLFDQHDICERVKNNKLDEVWNFWIPFTSGGEDDMVGPNPFFINGRTEYNANCIRNVPILNIDMTRTPVETQHSFGHRIENTIKKVYGSWNEVPKNNWDWFSISGKNKTIPIKGCGDVHFPPNTKDEYGYDRHSIQGSYCDSFYQYPSIDTKSWSLSICNIWGCTQDGYLDYWYKHLPHNDGVGPDGKLNNWWAYINDPELTIHDSGQNPTTVIMQADVDHDQEITSRDLALIKKMNKSALGNIDKKELLNTATEHLGQPVTSEETYHTHYKGGTQTFSPAGNDNLVL